VVEDENEVVVGYAVAILNAQDFRRKLNMSWTDVLRKMYPLPAEESYLKASLSLKLSGDSKINITNVYFL
jgi:hypothetical protein